MYLNDKDTPSEIFRIRDAYHFKNQKHALINIRRRRKVLWITPNVDGILRLVDSYPIDRHRSRERQMLEVDVSKVRRHSQIGDDVLS